MSISHLNQIANEIQYNFQNLHFNLSERALSAFANRNENIKYDNNIIKINDVNLVLKDINKGLPSQNLIDKIKQIYIMSEVIDYKYMKVTKTEYRKKFFKKQIRETADEIKTYIGKVKNDTIRNQINWMVTDGLDQLDNNPSFDKLIDLFIRMVNSLNTLKTQCLIENIQNDILTGKGQVLENIKIPVGEINNM